MEVLYISIDRNEVLNLTSKYVLTLANSKPFNVQMRGILNKYGKNFLNREKFFLSFDDFKKNSEVLLSKDFVYKNDFSTFRDFYIIDPDTYIYYTFQVFIIYFSLFEQERPFNNTHLKVFYSGKIENNTAPAVIKKNSFFNSEYEAFKRISKTYKGNKVLALDLQNFFESINLERLYSKLQTLLAEKEIGLEALQNLKSLFGHFEFDGLPQIHNSIASSVLSQIYLMELSDEINNLLIVNGWEGVRFVDDFYINLKDTNTSGDVNLFLSKISKKLFQEGLNFNSNKTQILSAEKFKVKINTIKDNYDNFEEHLNYNYFDVSNEINEKTESLLKNNGEGFINFIHDVEVLFNEKGLDLKEYKALQNKHLSINEEDASKVAKNIIFSRKWQRYIDTDRLLYILKKLELVYFDPINFTILFSMLYDHLKIKEGESERIQVDFVSDFREYYQAPMRLLIIYEQLIAQKKIREEEFTSVRDKFKEVDKKLCEYLEKYIF